jgi:hypothetical protein
VVKNGQIILLGTVASKADSDLANMQCNAVPNAFKVFNLLRVDASPPKKPRPPEAANRRSGPPEG